MPTTTQRSYEAVHPVASLSELKARLGEGRRCFGFFHPCLPDEPLVFVHVALLPEVAGSMAGIVNLRKGGEGEEGGGMRDCCEENEVRGGVKRRFWGRLDLPQGVTLSRLCFFFVFGANRRRRAAGCFVHSTAPPTKELPISKIVECAEATSRKGRASLTSVEDDSPRVEAFQASTSSDTWETSSGQCGVWLYRRKSTLNGGFFQE